MKKGLKKERSSVKFFLRFFFDLLCLRAFVLSFSLLLAVSRSRALFLGSLLRF